MIFFELTMIQKINELPLEFKMWTIVKVTIT